MVCTIQLQFVRKANHYLIVWQQVSSSEQILSRFNLDFNFLDLGGSSTQMLTNTTSSLTHISDTSMDPVANISVQDLPTTPSNPLNALTATTNNHMTSSRQITNKRERVVERSYGETLITMEALLKVDEKEKKTTNSKKTSKYINNKTVSAIFLTILYSSPLPLLIQTVLAYHINFSQFSVYKSTKRKRITKCQQQQ